MKNNKFFELLSDIDGKFINEADYGDKTGEGLNAEEINPQNAPKRKIYPAVLKTAACVAAVVLVTGAFIAIGKGTPDSVLSHGGAGSDGEAADSVSETSDISDIIDDTTDISDITDISDDISDNPYSEETPENTSEGVLFPSFEAAETSGSELDDLSYEESIQRNIAIEEWNGSSHVYPINDPDNWRYDYSYVIDWDGMDVRSNLILWETPGAEINAIADGEIIYVERADDTEAYESDGDCVVVKHNDYIYTEYRRIKARDDLNAGDKLEMGQVLGYVENQARYYTPPEEPDYAYLIEGYIKDLDSSGYSLLYGFYLDIRTDYLLENKVNKLYDRSDLVSALEPVGSTAEPISLTSTEAILEALYNALHCRLPSVIPYYKWISLNNGIESYINVDYVSAFVPAALGTDVLALVDGTVTEAEYTRGWGYCVTVMSDNGWVTKYAHLDEMKVNAGDRIKANQTVGTAGTTGIATAAGGTYILMRKEFKQISGYSSYSITVPDNPSDPSFADIKPFVFDIDLPNEWEPTSVTDYNGKYSCNLYRLNLDAYDESGDLQNIGYIDFGLYDPSEVDESQENAYRTVYSQLMSGLTGSWDCNYTPAETKYTEYGPITAGICRVMLPNTDSEDYPIGILAHNSELGIYMYMYLENSDWNSEDVERIAQSIVLRDVD